MNKSVFFSKTCKLITEHYGEQSQLNVAMEECAELIQAISKMQRNKSNPTNRENLIGELADVTIMIEQLKQVFDIREEEVDREVNNKLLRQIYRMNIGE